jgi:hypothetical protein
METKCKNTNKYKCFYPPNPDKHIWGHYYQYYYNNLHDNDTIIKCDDDIIYIDITENKFKDFIGSIDSEALYFPNIVNNDVCACLQQNKGIHDLFDYNINSNQLQSVGIKQPLTNWFTNYEKAQKIHKLFLNDIKKFNLSNEPIIEYGSRISINFFASKGSYAKKIFKNLNEKFYDDEGFIGTIPGIPHFNKHKINLNLTVCHFQFRPQNGKLLDDEFLESYENIANII